MKQAEIPLLRIISLGCAKNFVDTEVAAGALLCEGFGLTDQEEEADLLFINTCAFLKAARDEAEAVLKEAAEWKEEASEKRQIIVSGCIVEWDKDGKFRASHPEVDAWCGIDSIAKIGKVAKQVHSHKKRPAPVDTKEYIYDHTTPRLQLTAPHTAYLKIADGCDNCCTYCLIPSIRGSLRSRTVESVVNEAKSLLKNGVRELILIAQDSSAFGRDRTEDGKPELDKLLKELDKLPGDFYIRLMYLHPRSITRGLLKELSSCKHLIKCLEIPLQHVSDPILETMHRHISESDMRKIIHTLKDEFGFALRTTFMVGFPGETEEDFAKLKQFVQETGFTRLGVFAFSSEPGVPAAKLKGRVPKNVAQARCAELMKIQAKISKAANQELIGKEIQVIVDEMPERGSTALGRTLFDAPDIDNQVRIKGAKGCAAGDILTVRVESAGAYDLVTKLEH